MHDAYFYALLNQSDGQVLRHCHTSVFTACAAHGQRHKSFAFAQIPIFDSGHDVRIRIEKFNSSGVIKYRVVNRLIEARLFAQLFIPEWVWQEAHVGNKIGIYGKSVFETK